MFATKHNPRDIVEKLKSYIVKKSLNWFLVIKIKYYKKWFINMDKYMSIKRLWRRKYLEIKKIEKQILVIEIKKRKNVEKEEKVKDKEIEKT